LETVFSQKYLEDASEMLVMEYFTFLFEGRPESFSLEHTVDVSSEGHSE
jgi:hypothetical protein